MDHERLERALREGPVDEPMYVPGSFRPSRWPAMVLVASGIGGAIVLGAVIGLGLSVLRSPSSDVGPPGVDLEALHAELTGAWISDPVTREGFVTFMTDAGHATSDVEAFLAHDPIETTVTWGLNFDGRGNLVVFREAPEGPAEILSNGPYSLLPDGGLRWDDLGCVVSTDVRIEQDRLSFGAISLDGCDADERIAHTTIFELAPPYSASALP